MISPFVLFQPGQQVKGVRRMLEFRHKKRGEKSPLYRGLISG